MANQFFVIIDKRDSGKFQNFLYKNFSGAEKKLIKKYNSDSFWSFYGATIRTEIWSKIKKNDIIFLTVPKENFKIYGIVSHKLINSNIGSSIWSDEINSEQINHFIFFKKTIKFNFSYHELIQYSTSKITIPIPGIYEIKKVFTKIVQNSIKNKKSVPIKNKFRPKDFDISIISKTIPKKYKSEVSHYTRDPKLVKRLKELYQNKCQICNFTFEYKKGKFYSEVHHYNPLQKEGSNNIDNMIVVCPNHHAQFDYNLIAIEIDGKSVIDKYGKKIGIITFHKKHSLNLENIVSQLR